MIIVGVLLILIGLLVALIIGLATEETGFAESADSTVVLVALIGAVPGTITAVTGLVIALRAGKG